MSRWISKLVLPCFVLPLALVGCAPEDDASGIDREEIERGLTLEDGEKAVSGSFADDEHELRFHSEVFEAGAFEIEIQVNGMTITAQMDRDGMITHDGYASHSGEPTQMTDADREALAALSEALDELGPEVAAPVQRLRGFADLWSEFPSTKDMLGQVNAGFRSYTSICNLQNTYQSVTHDDWDYDRWDDATTYKAYIGMQAGGPCDDGTWFWTGSEWSCYEPDHSTSVEYAYGNCFGRCGGGCGSDSQLTWDCADHDSCVRFGHSIASLWCDDEFSSTVDDWASAPNCN